MLKDRSVRADEPEEPFGALIERAGRPGLRTAIVHPVDTLSLSGAMAGREAGLIEPVLVGPVARIEEAAKTGGLDLSGINIIDTAHSHAAAEESVKLAARGEVSALMKGALATSELMGACVATGAGLRTDRRMSHIFVMETPAWPTWLLISDGALNIAPDLMTKCWIVQNAIDLARAIGHLCPVIPLPHRRQAGLRLPRPRFSERRTRLNAVTSLTFAPTLQFFAGG